MSASPQARSTPCRRPLPLRPCAVLGEFATVAALADFLHARITSHRYNRRTGSVVVITPAGEVYVLREDAFGVDQFVASRHRDVLGWYAVRNAGRQSAQIPGLALLMEDLQCHLAQHDWAGVG